MLDKARLLVRQGAADNQVGETRCDLRGEVVDVDRFARFQSPSQTLLDEFVDRFGKVGHTARCFSAPPPIWVSGRETFNQLPVTEFGSRKA
jgi:hypothetical protein